LLKEETYDAGEIICEEGEPADKIYFLAAGRVSASVKLDHKRRHRLSASVAGWTFGESALFKDHIRTADIVADSSVRVYCLDPNRLQEQAGPVATQLRMKLLSNLSELSIARRNGPRILDSRLSVFCPHIMRPDHAATGHITLPA
jgi:CRP-like cAMP-binding protein